MHITNFIKTKVSFKLLDNNFLIQNKDFEICKISTKKQKKQFNEISN